MNLAMRVVMCGFSAGWLVPVWMGLSAGRLYWENQVLPILKNGPQVDGFAYVPYMSQCAAVALVWLGLVILYWSAKGTRAKRMED